MLRGDADEKIRFTFRVYDTNDDGFISTSDLYNLLSNSVTAGASNDGVSVVETKMLIKKVFDKFECSDEQKISLDQFVRVVEQDPDFLHLMGNCLPDSLDEEDGLDEIEGWNE